MKNGGKVADVADHVPLDGILQLPPPFLPVLRLARCRVVSSAVVSSRECRHARRAGEAPSTTRLRCPGIGIDRRP